MIAPGSEPHTTAEMVVVNKSGVDYGPLYPWRVFGGQAASACTVYGRQFIHGLLATMNTFARGCYGKTEAQRYIKPRGY